MTETSAAAWARCRRWIEAALHSCPTHAIEDVEAGIASGQFQFWPEPSCAAVTEISVYPQLTVLHHWLSGGDLRALLAQRAAIEDWARAVGCEAICGSSARPALGRILKPYGYGRGQIEYWKDLT